MSDLVTLKQDLLVKQLESIGWSLLNAEINLVEGTARIELSRHTDGLLVTFDARNDKSSVTREVRSVEQYKAGRKGDTYRAERLNTVLLGRQKCNSVQDGIVYLSNCLESNSPKYMTLEKGHVQNLLSALAVDSLS